MPAPLLVVGVGNPSRGDDALGPRFVDALGAALDARGLGAEVELLVDHQLQVEHALDLAGRQRVVFVDASVTAPAPYAFVPVDPRDADPLVGSHALSPATLLATALALGVPAPPAQLLALRGERFELGAPPSPRALGHLDLALRALLAWAFPRPGRVGWRLDVSGVVQGVGLRSWVVREARALGLAGTVRNTRGGLAVEAGGAEAALVALVERLRDAPPPGARVDGVEARDVPPPEGAFAIAPSDDAGPPRLAIPPDLGVCDACLADVEAPGRHHRYPLTSCVACGPRFAIATRLPWDRAGTTLADWPWCAACAAAVADPADRRFHAQGVGCAGCGPPVWLADPAGRRLDAADPVAEAAARLGAGALLAVQGVGAFHLVCDATNAEAVATLRARKRRETRPLAVLVADLDAAGALGRLDAEAEATLRSPARPIVLVPSRGGLPAAVGAGTRRVGLLLPYTPLHAALAAAVGRPLVVTSGNPAGAPAIIDADEAVATLGPLVDALLLHGRRIARRVEDSVVAMGPAGPRPIRRARGLAPRPIPLRAAAPVPILAVGGHLKVTATLVVDDQAFVGPHLGDLDGEAAEARFAEEVEGFERLLGVRAEVVAHDLHPDYASTRWAEARGGRRVGVQHHVAHALAALAEARLDEPVVAVVADGTGWGPDGTAWGAEVLVIDGARWTRVAAARALPLPGGEAAIRAPYRAALGALADAFGEEAEAVAGRFPALAAVPEAERRALLRMITTGTHTPLARGLGRWFDAAAALCLGIGRVGHEGQAALALEEAAGPDAAAYPVGRPTALALDGRFGAANELDLRPTVRALVADLAAGVPAAEVAARFHATWVDALADAAQAALAACGLRRVVLTGGAMQNDRLLHGLVTRLGPDRVVLPRELPVNDGGLSLGQAWAATLGL